MENNQKIIGVYKISNILSGRYYIGYSSNINRRFTVHRNKLKQNCHDNIFLQRGYNLDGEDKFIYDIIHIHDERIFPFLGISPDIKTVAEFIHWLCLTKQVIVIQIYKKPIERIISCFFEHITSFHYMNRMSDLFFALARWFTQGKEILRSQANEEFY